MSYTEVRVSFDKVYEMADGSLQLSYTPIDWLKEHMGHPMPNGNRQSKAYDIDKFVNSSSRWDMYVPGIGDQGDDLKIAFLFRDPADAMMFKLIWA